MRILRDLFGFVLTPFALGLGLVSVDVPRSLPVEPYADGVTPVYLDRPYVNAAPVQALEGQRIVRLPRHLRFDVELELAAPAQALRLTSEENDNAVFAGWEPVDALPVNVPGRSCALTRAVARSLAPGVHRLPPGGPAASAPLLVASDAAIEARTTSAWNKLTPGSGPLDFALRNKRKLAGLVLAWGGWCVVLLRWRARREEGTGLLARDGP